MKMKLKDIKPLCVKFNEAAALLSVRRKDIPALVDNGTLTVVRLAEGVERISMSPSQECFKKPMKKLKIVPAPLYQITSPETITILMNP